jgi:hypothetical protein
MTATASPFNENQPRKPNRHPAHLFIRHPATVSARFTQIEDCNPGQVIQPFRIHNQAKGSLGGLLKEVERVLRVFPARDDLFAPI